MAGLCVLILGGLAVALAARIEDVDVNSERSKNVFGFKLDMDRFVTGECEGKLEVGANFHGYDVLRCLGKGFDGEAYLVTKDGAEAVLKVGHVSQKECDFGRELKKVEELKDQVTNCTEHGATFIVMEKAPGRELNEALREAVEAPPPELKSLSMVVEVALGMVALHSRMMEHGHFHYDLHLGNIFITPTRHIVAIDYGRTCASTPEQKCSESRQMDIAGSAWFNLLWMLVKPSLASGTPSLAVPRLAADFKNGEGMSPGWNPSAAAEQLKKAMREAYMMPAGSEVDEQLTAVLTKGFTMDSYMHGWPPAWVEELERLKKILQR